MAGPTIMQIVPRVETGGSEQSALEINAALVKAGATSVVVSQGGRLADKIEADGGKNVILPAASKNPITMVRNAGKLARMMETEFVDLVHARSRAPAWSALYAARSMKRPFVTTYHGSYASPAPFKTSYNSVMARGDLVIANSQWTADMVHERHGTPYEKMPVIPRGLDASEFDPVRVSEDRKDRLRRAWGLGPDDIVLLQAARLTGWKGQRTVIDAAARLKAQGQLGHAVFILAGSAQGRQKYEDELRSMISEAGLEDRVRIVGHCDDMAAAHALAHVTIIASVQAETFGRASIEAQAMGSPVIVTAIGATPETLVPAHLDAANFTGWLVPAGDGAALAEKLAETLVLGKIERDEIGARARDHVARNFSLSSMQRRTLAVYDKLLGTRLVESFDR
ncbi:D-inositol 3-phosphate glycosyltransferase [Methyloligella halotolerans]|uniref:D-inositol 3-phosphate glycosyltransferase n=1 Tax=Methyloligella halotolerans TaxID=1177755 RepID=A0A1E2S087_9HYPH|nr:glycosyltransferase family 4 protein [Methyloligella halotolerans]ODA67810.1 D-inositol 3-phosphate glycosyltransferase [Methyloligella halotolerans]